MSRRTAPGREPRVDRRPPPPVGLTWRGRGGAERGWVLPDPRRGSRTATAGALSWLAKPAARRHRGGESRGE